MVKVIVNVVNYRDGAEDHYSNDDAPTFASVAEFSRWLYDDPNKKDWSSVVIVLLRDD